MLIIINLLSSFYGQMRSNLLSDTLIQAPDGSKLIFFPLQTPLRLVTLFSGAVINNQKYTMYMYVSTLDWLVTKLINIHTILLKSRKGYSPPVNYGKDMMNESTITSYFWTTVLHNIF